MQINRFSLSFSGDDRPLEEGFLKDYLKNSIRAFRIALMLGLFIYSGFGILDAILFPEIKEKMWFIRYALELPVLLAILGFSYSPLFKKYWQKTILFAVFFAGIGIIAMTCLSPATYNFSYYSGLILVLFFSYTVPRALFLWASATGWLLLACYEIAAVLIINTPMTILINNNFFFVGANLIGMIACYLMEYSARENYYLFHLLEKEAEKVSLINGDLQEKNLALEQALEKVKTLSGLIPICMHCKKIRDDQGYWNQLEAYLSSHSEAQFSHSLCPECMQELYPEIFPEKGEPAPPRSPIQKSQSME